MIKYECYTCEKHRDCHPIESKEIVYICESCKPRNKKLDKNINLFE